MSIIERLTMVAEDEFDCQLGQPRAFFELPQRIGEDIRVIYVTYAFRGDELDRLEQAMVDVLDRLSKKAGDDARLYWRLSPAFHVELVDEQYYLRTRLAVLDCNLDPVVLDDVVKRECEPTPVIA